MSSYYEQDKSRFFYRFGISGSYSSCAAILPPDQRGESEFKATQGRRVCFGSQSEVSSSQQGHGDNGVSAVAAEGQAAGVLHPFSGSRERWTRDAALLRSLPSSVQCAEWRRLLVFPCQ